MRVLLGISLVSLCCLLGAVEPPSAPPQKKADEKPLGSNLDNSIFGFFVGLSLNYDYIPSSITTDKENLLTYDAYIKDRSALRALDLSGFGVEARAGLIKTFSMVGIRAYGIYGRTWGSGSTINRSTPLDSGSSFGRNPKEEFEKNKDYFREDLDLSKTYYGGVVDLMFGFFAGRQESYYLFVGGGYVLNNYSLDGEISFGDPIPKNDPRKPRSIFSTITDENHYIAEVHSRTTTGNFLFNIGAGAFLFRTFMLEANVRLMMVPDFVSNSTLRYKRDPSYSSVLLKYADETPVIIKNSIPYDLTIGFNAIFVF